MMYTLSREHLPVVVLIFILVMGGAGILVRAQESVELALTPATVNVNGVGTTFTLDLEVRAGTQPVDGQESCLQFDSQLLEATEVLYDTGTFDIPLINPAEIDNNNGLIHLASGTFNGTPSGTFRVAQIEFTTVAAAGTSQVTFYSDEHCMTALTSRGSSLPLDTSGATVAIGTITPTFTPTPTPTDTPTFTPTPTDTPTDTPTPTGTPTDTPTPTPTPTDTPTSTPTDTPTATPTSTPTDTPTSTPTATPSGSVSAQAIPLNWGWTIISFNRQPASTAVADVMSPVAGTYDRVLGEEGSYVTSIPPSFNTLHEMLPARGYWIHATIAATLNITGTVVAADTPIALHTGWNWIGYLPEASMPVTQALASIDGKYTRVIGDDGTFDVNLPPIFNTLTEMEPGKGYLLYMNQSATLRYSTPTS